MNKIELVSLIREIVIDELKKNMKPIRDSLKEAVRKEVDKLLTEMETETAPQERIVERVVSNQGMKSSSAKRPVSPPLPQEKPTIALSKNPMLNSLLTQTIMDVREGRSQPIGSEERGGVPSVYMDGALEMSSAIRSGAGQLHGSIAEQLDSSGKSAKSMLPDTDVNGNPLVMNAVPDHVATAITRDYSKFLKKVDKRK